MFKKKSVSERRRSRVLASAMALMVVSGGMVATAQSASALCGLQDTDAFDTWISPYSTTMMTQTWKVPSGGTCNDINLRMVSRGGGGSSEQNIRIDVHFWDEKGKDKGIIASKTFSGKFPSSWWEAKQNVKAKSKYRVEYTPWPAPSPYTSRYGWVVGTKS